MRNYDRNKKYSYNQDRSIRPEIDNYKTTKDTHLKPVPQSVNNPSVATIGKNQLPKQFKDQLRNYYQQNQNLKIAYEMEKGEHQFLKKQIEEVKEKFEKQKKYCENLQNQYQELKEKYKRAKKKNSSIFNQSPIRKNDEDPKEIQNKFNKERELFIQEQKHLKDQIKGLTTKIQMIEKQKTIQYKKNFIEKDTELKRIKSNEQKLNSELSALKTRNSSLQRENQYTYGKLEQKQREIILTANRCKEIMQQNTRIREDIRFIEDQLNKLKKQNALLRKTIEQNELDYKSNIQKLQKSNNHYQNKLKILYDEVQNVKDLNRNRQEYYEDIKRTLDLNAFIHRSSKPNKAFSSDICYEDPSNQDLTKMKKSYGLIKKHPTNQSRPKSFSRI